MRSSRLFAFFFLILSQVASFAHAQGALPPAPAVKLAVNPLTNKVYMANPDANSVTALDVVSGDSKTIAVGTGPLFIAVNPATNRVYVNNARDASLSVIDGASDTLLATYPIGSTGPIAINPATNVVYIVRLTGTGSDEVTYFNAANNSWYTIATESFQPIAMAVNPVKDRIYVAHYATGDVRVISGFFDPNADFPATTSIGVFSHPFAIAANTATGKVYVVTEDSRGPLVVIDGATHAAVFPPVAAGHAQQPKALAVNPVSNKAYAAFAGEVIVIDGNTNALTYVPIPGSDSGPMALGINHATNRIYVATASGSYSVIDGDSAAVVASGSIPAGTSSVGVNPLTNRAYFFDTSLQAVEGSPGDMQHPNPLVATITPFPGDTAAASGTATIDASNGFSPGTLPVRAVYYQVDSRAGAWIAASGTGPWTASFSNLAAGTHTLHAFAVDGQDAPFDTGPQSIPLVGQVASYTFTVSVPRVDPTVSLSSSANPSNLGQPVTFTAVVTSSSGTPGGSVEFRDGAVSIAGCAAVALSGGAASCATASLDAGNHAITARYGGDASFNAASSAPLTQSVVDPNAPQPADLAVSQSLASAGASAGKDMVLILTVANNGPGNASGVVLTNPVPAGASFVWASPACANASGAVTCNVGTLASGATVQLQLVVRPLAPGSITNQPTVAASEADPSTGNNAASAVITVDATAAANAVLRYRLYSPVTQEHLFTTDRNEYDTLGGRGWTQEGTAGRVLDNPGSFDGVTATPYYRLYNTATRWHHWTTDPNEYYTLIQVPGWNAEGVDGYLLPSAATGAIPLYRLLYPDGRGLHHWTVDAVEYDTLVGTYGWVGEGGTGYVIR